MVVVKTKLAELRGAMIAKTKMMTMKNKTLHTAPIISSGSRIFVVKMLQNTGMAKMAHPSKVPCHWCGTYDALLKIIRPSICVPSRKAGVTVLQGISVN